MLPKDQLKVSQEHSKSQQRVRLEVTSQGQPPDVSGCGDLWAISPGTAPHQRSPPSNLPRLTFARRALRRPAAQSSAPGGARRPPAAVPDLRPSVPSPFILLGTGSSVSPSRGHCASPRTQEGPAPSLAPDQEVMDGGGTDRDPLECGSPPRTSTHHPPRRPLLVAS